MKNNELRNLVLGLFVGASGLTAWAAFSEFQAGTPIRAADVNAKLNDLDTRVTAKQNRISGTCTTGSSISAVAADGTVTCNGGAFIHVTTAANKPSGDTNVTCIDNALTNGRPNAMIQVTQNYGSSFIYNKEAIGVYYRIAPATGFLNQWCIFNQGSSAAPMPINATFNVFVAN